MATPTKKTAAKKTRTAGRVTEKKLKAPAELTIDIDSVSWDQLRDLRDSTGGRSGGGWTLNDFFDDGEPTYEGIISFMWFELRKTHPNVTIDEVSKLPFSQTVLAVPKPNPTKAG